MVRRDRDRPGTRAALRGSCARRRSRLVALVAITALALLALAVGLLAAGLCGPGFFGPGLAGVLTALLRRARSAGRALTAGRLTGSRTLRRPRTGGARALRLGRLTG